MKIPRSVLMVWRSDLFVVPSTVPVCEMADKGKMKQNITVIKELPIRSKLFISQSASALIIVFNLGSLPHFAKGVGDVGVEFLRVRLRQPVDAGELDDVGHILEPVGSGHAAGQF